MSTVRIEPEHLETFATSVLAECGIPQSIAVKVSKSLVAANIRGHNSHGVSRVPQYAEMVEQGAINPEAALGVNHNDPVCANIDGGSLFGQVVGRKAVEIGVEKAEESSIGIVGIKDAAHLGRIGEWAERTADEGLILCAFVNTQGGARTVTPVGSADRIISTNPLSVSIPTFDALDFDIVLDMATSQVANGKIYEKAEEGKDLPEEWTTLKNGNPVLDPSDFIEKEVGALLPLGGRVSGHKGFGLAVIVELLASNIGDGVATGETEPEWFSNAACFIFIDPLRFTTKERLEERVSALEAHIRSATRSPDIPMGDASRANQTLLPGEPEYRAMAEQQQKGISLPLATIEELEALSAEVGSNQQLR